MIVSVVGSVDCRLLGANIVRPDWLAEAFSAFGDKAATSKEIHESWRFQIQEANRLHAGTSVNDFDRGRLAGRIY